MAQQENPYVIDAERNDNLPSEGAHVLKLEDVKHSISNNGNPMFTWRWKVVGSNDPDAGKAVWVRTVLLPQNRWTLDPFLDAIGAPLTGKVDVRKYINKHIRANVIHQTGSDGVTRADLRSPLPYKGSAPTPSGGFAAGSGGDAAAQKRMDEMVQPSKLGNISQEELPF
jgi:hypothetical protein